jgi:hypothetical protein
LALASYTAIFRFPQAVRREPKASEAPAPKRESVYKTRGLLNDHLAVRVVGNSARVIADALPPDVERRLAGGPMPIPLSGPAVAYLLPLPQGRVELFPVTIHNEYRPHWTVPAAGQ